ncbi:MAG: sulfatase [Vicinamibacteria bacterium]
MSQVRNCRRHVLWALGLAVLPSVTACSQDSAQPARQVVFVILDAARADRFGADGYARATTPNIDALAARGIWFENHFTQATTTRTSLPGLLYSRYFTRELFPNSASVPFEDPRILMQRFDDEAISLPRALSTAGFLTAVISAHSWLRAGTRFAKEFDELHDLSSTLTYPHEQGYPSAEQVIDESIGWIAGHRGDDYFLYIHLMDTHFPHSLTPDAEYFLGEGPHDSGRLSEGGWPTGPNRDALSAQDRRFMDALYDGSLRYVDRQIGRLVDDLDGKGLLSQTLIVITSDHGEHLLEVSDRFAHGGPWYDDVARIPLILAYGSRLEPQRVSSFTESVDVFPTILELMGVSLPPEKSVDGVSMVGVAQGLGKAKDYAFGQSGARDRRFKAIFSDPPEVLLSESLPERAGPTGELYDVSADPLEQTNLWESEPEEVERLLLAYRVRLAPSYVRAASAINHDQPEAPFAIASRHFELNRDVPESQDPKTLASDAEGGWLRSTAWEGDWLLAGGAALPLEIQFSIPNGLYRVTAHIRGSGTFQLEKGEATRLKGSDYEPGTSARGEAMNVGSVTISDETFRAEIHPSGTGYFLVQMIGFEPLGAGSAAEEQDEDLLERLKTLGYVNND